MVFDEFLILNCLLGEIMDRNVASQALKNDLKGNSWKDIQLFYLKQLI